MSDSKRLERIEDKLDIVSSRLGSIDGTLIKQQDQLEYHIKRTDLAEERMNKFEAELEPVIDHVKWIKTLGKLTFVISAIAAIIKFYLSI